MLPDFGHSVARLLHRLPGKKIFGLYRFLPLFFITGALLEFSMINWEAGASKTNFYKTYINKTARETAEQELAEEERRAALAATSK